MGRLQPVPENRPVCSKSPSEGALCGRGEKGEMKANSQCALCRGPLLTGGLEESGSVSDAVTLAAAACHALLTLAVLSFSA